jgi:flagellar biosynthesis regulator FlaF
LAATQAVSVDDVAEVLTCWLEVLSTRVRFAHSQNAQELARVLGASEWSQLGFNKRLWQALYDDVLQVQQQLQRANQLNALLLFEQLWLKLAKLVMKAQQPMSM